jgi:hypothetical protein
MIIAAGLTMAVGSGTASAAPAQACAVSTVIEITNFSFNPSAVPPGKSSTATLSTVNCTNQPQQTSEIWSGRFVGTSTGIPPGCPVIDPIAIGVNYPPLGFESTSVGYLVPQSCTATQLIVTVTIDGNNGVVLARGQAVLNIISPTG